MAYRANVGGLMGSGEYMPSAPQIDVAGAINALSGAFRSNRDSVLRRTILLQSAQRANAQAAFEREQAATANARADREQLLRAAGMGLDVEPDTAPTIAAPAAPTMPAASAPTAPAMTAPVPSMPSASGTTMTAPVPRLRTPASFQPAGNGASAPSVTPTSAAPTPVAAPAPERPVLFRAGGMRVLMPDGGVQSKAVRDAEQKNTALVEGRRRALAAIGDPDLKPGDIDFLANNPGAFDAYAQAHYGPRSQPRWVPQTEDQAIDYYERTHPNAGANDSRAETPDHRATRQDFSANATQLHAAQSDLRAADATLSKPLPLVATAADSAARQNAETTRAQLAGRVHALEQRGDSLAAAMHGDYSVPGSPVSTHAPAVADPAQEYATAAHAYLSAMRANPADGARLRETYNRVVAAIAAKHGHP